MSRSPAPAPVSTPLKFVTTRHQRFAHARLPDPHLTRSWPRLFRSAHHERHLTDAACGGLRPPPEGRPRRTYLHLLHSTASGGYSTHASFSVRHTRTGQTRSAEPSPWTTRGKRFHSARRHYPGTCKRSGIARPGSVHLDGGAGTVQPQLARPTSGDPAPAISTWAGHLCPVRAEGVAAST